MLVRAGGKEEVGLLSYQFCGLSSGHRPECSSGIAAHPFSLRYAAVDLVCATLFAQGHWKASENGQ